MLGPVCNFQHAAPAQAAGIAPVLRGSSLEIVDSQGRVRAGLNVLPAGRSRDGTTFDETVLPRLITQTPN
jgi:hypothetical protein